MKLAKFIKEEELFYNRQDVWYARTQFPMSRKGYLHMCHFMCNFYGYPNTDYHLYDYSLHIDDESQFTEDVPYDFFERMEEMPEVDMAAMKCTTRTLKSPTRATLIHELIFGILSKYISSIMTSRLNQSLC